VYFTRGSKTRFEIFSIYCTFLSCSGAFARAKSESGRYNFMQHILGCRRRAAALLAIAVLFLATANIVLVAQNLGAAPQTNVAVQGQTGAQPEGAFLNLVNWVGNVIAPVGAALAVVGGLVMFIAGRGALRFIIVALGCLAVSGLTRLLEFWINQGGGGVS
jgi:hypothetical protein